MERPTGLVDAARAGDFDTVFKLLKKGHDADERDEFGGTALMYAVGAHDENAVRCLIEHGANIAIVDFDGRTALDYAIAFSCPDSITKLLRRHSMSSNSLLDSIHVRGMEPQDVINYARGHNPDLGVVASMLRSLDSRQQLELTMKANSNDIELFQRALKEH